MQNFLFAENIFLIFPKAGILFFPHYFIRYFWFMSKSKAMKKYVLISVFSFLFLGLFSQDTLRHHLDTAGVLKIEHIVKGNPVKNQIPFYIFTGQHIRVRTFSDKQRQSGVLTAVGENSLVIDSTKEIPFSAIREISFQDEFRAPVFSNNACYIIGGTMMAAGAATWINVLYNDWEPGDGKLALALLVGSPLMAFGLAMFQLGVIQIEAGPEIKFRFPLHYRISAADTKNMIRTQNTKQEKVKPDKLKRH